MSFAEPSRSRTALRYLAMVICTLLAVVAFGVAWISFAASSREVLTNHEAAPEGGRWVSAGDCEIFVQEMGSATAPAVVFIHGTGAWSETWRPVLDAVSGAGFHAIALDLPPFGYSSRPASQDYSRTVQGRRIVAALASLRLRDPILVGHSFGARATLTAVLQSLAGSGSTASSSPVRKVIFVDPALGFIAPGESANVSPVVSWLLSQRIVRETLVAATLANPSFTRKLLSGFVYEPEKLTDAEVAIYQRPMNQKGNAESVGAWLYDFIGKNDATLSEDVTTFAEKAKLPITLIWGNRDAITPMWQAEKLKQEWPAATLIVLKDVGHIPQIESPTEFVKALLPELDR